MLNREQIDPVCRSVNEQIECYEYDVPDFVAKEMDRCYGAMYASIPYLRLTGKLTASTCTYIAFSKGKICSIFLFERKGAVVDVLNAQFKTTPEEVGRFADYIFNKMPDITRISFPAIHMSRERLRYPCQQFFSGEDIVISFSGTGDEYTRQIGKGTRKTLRRRAAAFELRHPSLHYKIIPWELVNAELINCIVNWNRERMSSKNKISTYKDEDVERYMAMAGKDSWVGAVMVEDTICAATFCCRFGGTYYMIMTSHAREYEEFSPGMLCCYWAAKECLRLKSEEINMMCGRIPYKYTLLAESRKYDCLTMYRDRIALFRNLKSVVWTALRGHTVEAKFALLDCERKDGRAARLVTRALMVWRASKKIYRRSGPTNAA